MQRFERWALPLLVGLMLLSLFVTVHPWYDPTNDGAMYLLTARALEAGDGYSMLGMPFRIRPPGFAWLLSFVTSMRDIDFQVVNVFVSLWGVAGCAALFVYLRDRLTWVVAFLVALALWLNPLYQELCNQPMSDVPGLTLALGCLLLERRAESERSLARDALLGLAIGLATYVRTLTLILVPAIFLARLFRRSLDRRFVILAAVVFAVQLPWSIRNANHAFEEPAEQTLLHSYSAGMFHEDGGDPNSRRLELGEIFARIPENVANGTAVLGRRLVMPGKVSRSELREEEAFEPIARVLGGLLVACLAYIAFKRREAGELWALASLAILAVYFGFAPRLLLPAFAFALPAAIELVQDLLRARGPAIAGTLLALLALGDARPQRDWDEIEREHRQLERVCERFEAQLDESDVLASARGWHYAVFLERDVYTLEFAARRAMNAQTKRVDPRSIERLIDEHGITAVLLSPKRARDRVELLPYFEARYGPQTDPVARVYEVR